MFRVVVCLQFYQNIRGADFGITLSIALECATVGNIIPDVRKHPMGARVAMVQSPTGWKFNIWMLS